MKRLDQLLSSLGYCSRKDAHRLIRDERVAIEGVTKILRDEKYDPNTIKVDGEPLDYPDGLLLILHKPVGYVCSHDEREGQNVFSLLPHRWQCRHPAVETVGRLDKDTSGLLLLTDQHELIHKFTSPKYKVEKVYEAVTEGPLPPEAEEILASGTLVLHGEKEACLPAKLERISRTEYRLTLCEGRYHQVRRMFGALGAPVLKLHRSRVGEWDLGELKSGEWKTLPLENR